MTLTPHSKAKELTNSSKSLNDNSKSENDPEVSSDCTTYKSDPYEPDSEPELTSHVEPVQVEGAAMYSSKHPKKNQRGPDTHHSGCIVKAVCLLTAA